MMVPDSFSIFAPSSRVHIQIGEFISLDSWDFMCIMYIEIAELDCCQIEKKLYICTIHMGLYTCLMSIPRFVLQDKTTVNTSTIEAIFNSGSH